MYPTLRECFLEIEQEGWLDERDIARDIARDIENAKTIARNLLRLGRPVDEVAIATELPIEMVKALA